MTDEEKEYELDGQKFILTAKGFLAKLVFGDEGSKFITYLKPTPEHEKALIQKLNLITEECLILPDNYKKIPFMTFLFVREYFAYVYKQHKTEAVALYHWDEASNNYVVVIPPISSATGSHIKYWAGIQKYCNSCYLGDPSETSTNCAFCGATDMRQFIFAGSTHSHGSMGAFHSATDDDNEMNRTGMHITIGKVDSQMFEAKPSFVVAIPPHIDRAGKGTRFLPELSELVEAPFTETEYASFEAWSRLIASKENTPDKLQDGQKFLRTKENKEYLTGANLSEEQLNEIARRWNVGLTDQSPNFLTVVSKSTPVFQTAYSTTSVPYFKPGLNPTQHAPYTPQHPKQDTVEKKLLTDGKSALPSGNLTGQNFGGNSNNQLVAVGQAGSSGQSHYSAPGVHRCVVVDGYGNVTLRDTVQKYNVTNKILPIVDKIDVRENSSFHVIRMILTNLFDYFRTKGKIYNQINPWNKVMFQVTKRVSTTASLPMDSEEYFRLSESEIDDAFESMFNFKLGTRPTSEEARTHSIMLLSTLRDILRLLFQVKYHKKAVTTIKVMSPDMNGIRTSLDALIKSMSKYPTPESALASNTLSQRIISAYFTMEISTTEVEKAASQLV